MEQTKKESVHAMARRVEDSFPPGTKMRRVRDGKLYFMGAKSTGGKFWMMAIDPPEKGLVPAEQVLTLMEKAEDPAPAKVGPAAVPRPAVEFNVG